MGPTKMFLESQHQSFGDMIDPRTDRMWGDYGTGTEAIEWGLAYLHPLNECIAIFLKNRQQGEMDEYPEYLAWLKEQEGNRLL